jgi:hypothetical protein
VIISIKFKFHKSSDSSWVDHPIRCAVWHQPLGNKKPTEVGH